MPGKNIKSILVANRGEPVRRAIKTCRQLGIEVCAVYVDEDRKSDWVSECGRAFRISSYLNGGEIAETAGAAKIDAIWPAWGFLSESAGFARLIEERGIIWIGPDYKAMAALSHKGDAARLAGEAGLDTIPEAVVKASLLNRFDYRRDFKEGDFPLIVKPAMGGGGQGQVVIGSPDGIADALETAGRINESQFGGGDLVIQRYLKNVRHIEFQLLADRYGGAVVMGERDCSIQRRNQKIIEESPSPAMTAALRLKTIDSIIKFARGAGYSSAGTVEFLFSGGRLYFLEVNTRLQVEHPVTEETVLVNGSKIDILEEMIRIAEGEPLRFAQADIKGVGHAVEARIYAEDVEKDFRPSPGRIHFINFSRWGNVRVDSAFSGVEGEVSSKFDPMVAKVIACGRSRREALNALSGALSETVILGVASNVSFCKSIIDSAEFASGAYSTDFVSKKTAALAGDEPDLWLKIALLSVVRYEREREDIVDYIVKGGCRSVQSVLNAVPRNGAAYLLSLDDIKVRSSVGCIDEGKYIVEIDGRPLELDVCHISGCLFSVSLPSGGVRKAYVYLNGSYAHVVTDGHGRFIEIDRDDADLRRSKDPHAAPTGGRISAVGVKAGERVQKGDLLYVVEAMKMETRVKALHDGVVSSILLNAGDVIETGDRVVSIEGVGDDSEGHNSGSLPQNGRLINRQGWRQAGSAESPLARLVMNPLSSLNPDQEVNYIGLIGGYFKGYDISSDCVRVAARLLTESIKKGGAAGRETALFLADLIRFAAAIKKVFSEDHISGAVYFLEHIFEREKRVQKTTLEIIENIFGGAYRCPLRDLKRLPSLFLRLLQAYQVDFEAKMELMYELVSWFDAEAGAVSKEVADAIAAFIGDPSFRKRGVLFTKYCDLLRRADMAAYYRVVEPPVAPEYYEEYRLFLESPIASAKGAAVNGALPPPLAGWFEGFEVLELPLPENAVRAGVHLFQAGRRLIGVVMPAFTVPVINGTEIESIPELERGAIEAYKAIKSYSSAENSPNHVFIIVPESFVLPWSADSASFSLSLAAVKKLSKRVAGFAHGLNISATEVVIKLKDDKGRDIRSILEIRHAGTGGIVSRPPYPLGERRPEREGDGEKTLNDKQQRLGKLLNRDRARLLFDDGDFEEIGDARFGISPAEGSGRTGLNVYKGRIFGRDVLCYAGDYRIAGGALGDREGRKLAASVVLAYCMGLPLIGIHDGAGANIKGSVSSLGWAGAYFGAIANTGGFSSHEKFLEWLNGHHEREYFKSVLANFGISDVESRAPLVHIHLHLGAAVGMLVYGPSISSMSIMADHPEVYRVLTGSATVEKMIGEKAANYELGGAFCHAARSGEIDFVLPTEEAAIRHARGMIEFLKRGNFTQGIGRNRLCPQPALPESAAVILGRDAILANVDDGLFYETRPNLEGAGGVMTGFARLAGRPVVIAASATDYGISNARSFKKVKMAVSAAQDFRLPFILITGANWDSLAGPAGGDALYQRGEMRRMLQTANVPRFSVALGPRGMERSIHQSCDFMVCVKRGSEADCELLSAGRIAHAVTGSLAEAFDWISTAASYLDGDWVNPEKGDAKSSGRDGMTGFTWKDLSAAYDMRRVISAVFDDRSFFEIMSGDIQPLVTGFARLDGMVAGIIADDPSVGGGAQTVHSISKFTRFNRICERFDIPIVELNDSPAFTPGSVQEHSGIQGEGGKSIREECLSRNFKIAVTLRQNYGGRLIHANLKTLGPPRMGLVLENSKVGVMGAKGAIGVLCGKRLAMISDKREKETEELKLIREYETEKLNPDTMTALGYAEKKIKLSDLRCELISLFQEEGKRL